MATFIKKGDVELKLGQKDPDMEVPLTIRICNDAEDIITIFLIKQDADRVIAHLKKEFDL